MSSELVERERLNILHGLGSTDEEMRRLSVERLAGLPAADAVPHWIACLGDESWRVRKAAVERLVACPENSLVDGELIAALGDGDNPGRRNSAVEALTGMGERVVPNLIAALDADDGDIRKLVVDTVAGIGGERAREAMIATLRDADVNVRAAAADALGVITGDGVEVALRACARDDSEDNLVRFSALRALVGLEARVPVDELAGVLADPMLCAAGYSLLGHLDGEVARECLMKGLASSSRASREAVIESLVRLVSREDGTRMQELVVRIREAAFASEGCVRRTLERLPEADLATRLTLVQFLGLVATPECVVAILDAGRDEAITELSLRTLESLGEVTERTLDEAWDELDPEQRHEACRLFGRTRGPLAEARLLTILDEADVEMRMESALSLGRGGCAEAIPALVRRLQLAAQEDEGEADGELDALVDGLVLVADPDRNAALTGEVVVLLEACLEGAGEPLRFAIASVLGRIGRPQEETVVVSLLKDPSSRVRRAAVQALSRMKPGSDSEPLRLALADESASVRMVAAEALASCATPRVVDDLQRLVEDEDWGVRAATMRALGSHCVGREDCPSCEKAIGLIASRLSDEGVVALAAVEALERMGGERAALLACGLLDRPEPELVRAAAACIGAHGSGDQVLALLPLVSHTSWLVRAEAIQALADHQVPQAVTAIRGRLETEQDSFVRDTMLQVLKRMEAAAE
jgi:HEAT repeat protein